MSFSKKIFGSLVLVLASSGFAEPVTIDQTYACNQKKGVVSLKTKDSYACDEPVNVFSPVIIWHNHKQKPDTCKVMLLGLEHRYEKPSGLNTKIHLSGMKQSKANHYHFQVEGSYKFLTQYDTAVFPTVAMSWSRLGVEPLFNENDAYLWRNCLHAGLGIERAFQNILLLGVKAHLIKDLDTRTFGEFSRTFMGTLNTKSISYRVSPYIHLSLYGKGVFEVEPYYGKCFKDKFEEMGCKMSYSVAF